MNLKRISHCAAVLATVLLTPHVQAADNLHFYGNLLSKSCTLVVQGETLAEVHFPTISRKDLMVTGQSARVPVVFQLKDCKGPAQYEVRVTLTGTEDSEQPGFLALDASSAAQGVGIGMEKTDGTPVPINNTSGATFVDAPRDKCTLSCAINGIHAAFHYLKKNYISGCVMTVPTG